MNDKLKDKAKKERIEIPESFEMKFEEALNSLPNRKIHKKNKYAMVASLALTIIISTGVVMAISDNIHKYIPSSGVVFDGEEKVYGLDETIIQKDNNGEKIELDMWISENEKMNRGVVSIGGKFNSPKSSKSILKIGDKEYTNKRGEISKLDYTWGATDIFEDIKDYKESDKIVYSIYLNDKDKVDFNIKLKEIKGVSKYEQLGITSEYNNIPITAIAKEKEEYMIVDFMSSKEELNMIPGTDYGDGIFSNIYLLDGNNEKVNGVREIKNGMEKYNRIKFDTRNLVKPYKIIIPQIRVDLPWEFISGAISEEIELSIPKNNKTVEINKEVNMNQDTNFVNTENDSVRLINGRKENNQYIVEIEYSENKKLDDELIQVFAYENNIIGKDTLVPGETIVDKNGNFVKVLKFDINQFSKKLKFKLQPISYNLKGNWEFIIK